MYYARHASAKFWSEVITIVSVAHLRFPCGTKMEFESTSLFCSMPQILHICLMNKYKVPHCSENKVAILYRAT